MLDSTAGPISAFEVSNVLTNILGFETSSTVLLLLQRLTFLVG